MYPRFALAAALVAPLACTSHRSPSMPPAVTPSPAAPVRLDALAENQSVNGFRAVTLYVDDDEAPIGARFVHEGTGFTLAYLRIESAPQAFAWVNTFPTSDRGEPHTQEHLLLGKGKRGQALGNIEVMALAESSAFTMQWLTCYHFHSIAGPEGFWTELDNQLDALLNPDYTDEEIRREVRNFGVDQDAGGRLRLEEKGTVYNEMVRSYENPTTLLWRAADHLVWGATHPLALSSGGWPDAIRAMTPEDIRAFHREHYYLGNMGMIAAFPASMELGAALGRIDALLDRLAGRTGDAMTLADLPAPAPGAPGTIELVDYPHAEADRPSTVALIWPATRPLEGAERALLELFVSSVAGDEGTNLYARLVDSKTRVIDVGATGVWGFVSPEIGHPIYIGLEGVAPRSLTEKGVAEIRAAVLAELARIAALPAGDPELAALEKRMRSRLIETRRRLVKFLDSPPGFGYRNTGSGWIQHLIQLEGLPGFRKSLTLEPELARVEQVLETVGNPWGERLRAWGLLETPFGLAGRSSPTLRRELDASRHARVVAETARLAEQYRTTDEAEVLRRFRADYDAATAALDASARSVPMPAFQGTPPMTLDDLLDYEKVDVAGVPFVRSRIPGMTGSSVGIAFRVDGVREDQLVYLGLLPALLSEGGLYEDGRATTSAELKEALRAEILGLSASYTFNARTGRVELLVTGAGNDAGETGRALAWMARMAAHPDWRVDNLPRLRDVVEQSIQGYRNVMLGPEEYWAEGLATTYWRQRWPLFAHTGSFLTQLHDMHRLRWMLSDPGDPQATAAAAALLRELAGAGELGRAKLIALARALEGGAAGGAAGGKGGALAAAVVPDKALAPYLDGLTELPAAVRALAAQAGEDLGAILADLPDDSLAADWAYLCRQMATDLERGAPAALAALDEVRRAIFASGNARGWLVGSPDSERALADDVAGFVATLPSAPVERRHYAERPFVIERLRGRRADATAPVYVGLVAPSTQSGVHMHSAPSTSFLDDEEGSALDFLAANLYGGQGGHSLFMKTWGAGLAYSNGVRANAWLGRVIYLAERCPQLPQTIRFVIDELRATASDPALVEYAVAQSFSSRVAASYEGRARGIADDLADGVTPERVRAFRQRVLDLRGRDGLAAELHRRMMAVYGRVLPGLGGSLREVADGVSFVIGPDAQLDAWASYLATVDKGSVLYKLYPRDFWITAPAL